jgi:ribosomal protein S27E
VSQHTSARTVASRPSLASCPHCEQPQPTFLAETSQHATVDYFRCAACGHVCHTPKGHTADVEPVTVCEGEDVEIHD